MVIINKDREVSILVFAFFVFAFLVFLFMKPSFTGMVVVDGLNVNNITLGNSLTGTVALQFEPLDVIPCLSNVSALIKDSSSIIIKSDTITLETFLSGGCADLQTFNDVNHVWTWEGQTGRGFSPGTQAINKSTNVNIFTNITTFDTSANYTFEMSLRYGSDTIDTKSRIFQVVGVSTDTKKPQITSVVFVNENGSKNFMKSQYVNCSAFVKDDDSASVSVSYVMWGSNSSKTSMANPGTSGSIDCSGSDWSTGKTCSVKDKVGKSDIGYWNCTIVAFDGTNYNYSNSTYMLMVNSPPKLKKAIENITWNKNENNTELDLDDYFEDPDEQSMNYSASSTSYIDITIKSNGDVTLIPQYNWLGNENVTFTAEDEKGAETESNTVRLVVTNLLNCTYNWNCGNWSNCIGGTQTRICTDLNNCSITVGRPPTLQNCSGLTVTCGDDGYCKAGCIGGDPDCSCTDQGGYLCGASMNCSSTLLSSDSGVCCSEPCSSLISTTGKSGTSGFLGSQTDRILIGVGTIAAVVFIVALIIIFNTYMDKRKAVVAEEKPAQVIEQAQPKSLDITPVKIKPTNTEKMKDYIEQSLTNKVPMRIIKGELNKVGWTESDIDNELNIARLRSYIQIKLNQGIPRAQIEQSLRMKGWSQSQIDEASKNTKVRPLI